MFKGILTGSKRTTSQDTTQTLSPYSGDPSEKENRPQQHQQLPRDGLKPWVGMPVRKEDFINGASKLKEKDGRLVEAGAMNRAFEKMLDDMQIPSTLRPKLVTLDSPVKAAMLKSSHTLGLVNAAAGPAPSTVTPDSPSLRRTRSTETLSNSPSRTSGHGHSPSLDLNAPFTRPNFGHRPLSGSFAGDISFEQITMPNQASMSRSGSMDILSAPDSYAAAVNGPEGGKARGTKAKGGKEKEKEKELTPEVMCAWLSSTKSTTLEVEKVKKLRILLRNEAASWSETFLRQGGYAALLKRLNELLEMEWREEQHDDQALHEILRCFKALSTSSIGCFALRSSSPSPFVQLVALLYSDKKPGDICTRQLIVDLLLILFELYPSAASQGSGKSGWEFKGSGHVIPPARPLVFTRPTTSPGPSLPAPHTSMYSLMRALLLTPRPPPSESPSAPVSPHAFIASLHLPRIYKVYLKEVSDVCRDYFWAFCHPTNTIWDLSKTDEEKVEKPRAPNAITGGVEFEAMTYLTAHLRLVNNLARSAAELDLPATDEQSAYKLHGDLFASGFEPIILTARKASTTYYPTLHLELARYVLMAAQAKFELPYSVFRLIGMPPAGMYKTAKPVAPESGYSRNGPPRPGSPILGPSSPSKWNAGVPVLPPPRRMEELKF